MGMDAAFATLGLAAGAQPIEITRAFRALSRASHPDRGGDRRRFEAVLAAYRALQRAGLVPRTSTSATPAPHAAPTSHVAARYRAFVRDLDRAAAMVVAPVVSPPRAVVREQHPTSARSFAEILERELLRAAA